MPSAPARPGSATPPVVDIAVVGAGAAGLAAAAWAARTAPGTRVLVLDGARTLGAKILVSGGGRCNVTNSEVTERDFNGGPPRLVRHVLRAFPVAATVNWFNEMGVALNEEPLGKLFPDSNRARTVLDALVGVCRDAGVRIAPSSRVTAVGRVDIARGDGRGCGAGFEIVMPAGTVSARRVILATGGLALPKSGSDGAGYAFAASFGHRLVPTTPALVPLVLASEGHAALSGVALPCRLRLEMAALSGCQANEGAVLRASSRPVHIEGSLLWTHTGVSGPAVLDVSRHWLRAALEDRGPVLSANWLAGEDAGHAGRWLLSEARDHPRSALRTALARRLPASMAEVVGSPVAATAMAELRRDERRAIVQRLTAWRLDVAGSRGYTQAEATAGGIALDEIDTATMESRYVPGLHLVGELLDVDGRLGGFNFQWAWSSGYVAGRAAARLLSA